MTLFVFGIIIIAALFIAFGFKTEKYSENGRVKVRPIWKLNGKQFIALAGLIVIGLSCMTSVPTGHTGIVTTFGKVEDYTFEAGVHVKMPWQDVVKMDNRNQKGSLDMTCFSSDIQEVRMVYSVNYQIQKTNAQNIYRSIGVSYYETVMIPRIQEAVKSVVAQYTADELVENRNELSDKIMGILTEDLATYNIEVLSTAVEDMDFTDAFTDAVEAKQVAAQNKLQAEIAQQQATMEAEAAAKRKVIEAQAQAETDKINAEAEAEVKKIDADAAEYVGQKEAEINKMLAESMTEALLQFYLIEGWDGKLPETFVGADGNVMSILDLAEMIKDQQTQQTQQPEEAPAE
ncbi:MAG: prohibitin family protein [Clostridia bacterium]|nr:prohibitin family protein [Clostridia bacterium]